MLRNYLESSKTIFLPLKFRKLTPKKNIFLDGTIFLVNYTTRSRLSCGTKKFLVTNMLSKDVFHKKVSLKHLKLHIEKTGKYQFWKTFLHKCPNYLVVNWWGLCNTHKSHGKLSSGRNSRTVSEKSEIMIITIIILTTWFQNKNELIHCTAKT